MNLFRWLHNLLHDDNGQDLVEYALVVATVSLVLISSVNSLSQAIVSLYQSMTADVASIGQTGR
jgi:Flp pilus assembly pilin Flp